MWLEAQRTCRQARSRRTTEPLADDRSMLRATLIMVVPPLLPSQLGAEIKFWTWVALVRPLTQAPRATKLTLEDPREQQERA